MLVSFFMYFSPRLFTSSILIFLGCFTVLKAASSLLLVSGDGLEEATGGVGDILVAERRFYIPKQKKKMLVLGDFKLKEVDLIFCFKLSRHEMHCHLKIHHIYFPN